MRITKWLFLLSLILFPLGEIVRIPIAPDIFIKPLDVAVMLTSLMFCIFVWRSGNIQKNFLSKPFVIFACVLVLSLLINMPQLNTSQFLVASSYLLRWVAYSSLFFVVTSFDDSFKKKIIHGMFWSGLVILMLGFVQYVFYPDLRNLYYLGWDEHLYRLFSTFLDPNFTAVFLTLFFMFLLSARNKISFLKNNLILFSMLSINLIGIVLTYSRSGMIMFAVSIAVFFLLQKRIKIVSLLFLVLLLFILLSTRIQFSEGTNLLRTASTFSRLDSAQEAIRLINSSPIIGVGFNAYKYALEKQNIDKPTKATEQHANTGTDTSLLFVFATSGVIGLVAYLYLLKSILLFTFNKHKKGNVLALGMFAGLAGLLINSLFVNSLFYPFIMYWMWTNLGLIEKE